MRKPVLLLVDDDRAVLGALEAAFAEGFETVCRVEAFDDPREVLEASLRWAAEGRLVAVAIVDQKMPGLTGVEMLKRVRSDGTAFAPFRHAGTILLTGYAGLDSALEAKNEAGVDRYLEKPWSIVALIDEVASLLRRFLRRSALGDYLVFREAESAEEARVLLTRRWEIARLGAAGMFAVGSGTRGELDPYDLRSHHLGLFLHDAVEPTIVGTSRVSVDGPGPLAEALVEASDADPDGGIDLAQDVPAPLPVLAHFARSEALRRFHGDATIAGLSVVEPTVPLVDPAIQAARAFHHAIACSVTFCRGPLSADRVLVFCPGGSGRFYERLGFGTIDTLDVEGAPGSSRILGSKGQVPAEAAGTLDLVQSRLEIAGHACQCASYPECFPGPYVTGEFDGIDVLCPMEAERLVGRDDDPRAPGGMVS